MGVVDVQIEHRPADLSRVVEVGQPGGIGDDPLEMPAEQLAVLAAGDRLVGELVLGEERQHVADQQQLAGLLGRLDHARGVGRRQRDRLLAEDVLAGLQGGDGHLGVPRRRQADVDHVEVRIGQHLVEVGVAGDAR